MVEYNAQLDNIFASLADPIRRDILLRARQIELSVNEIASRYDISLAAVSKHLKVLREAGLISRRKRGRYQMVTTRSDQLQEAAGYIKNYEALWTERLDALDSYLQEMEEPHDNQRDQETRD